MTKLALILMGFSLAALFIYQSVFATASYPEIAPTYRIAVSHTPLSAPFFVAQQHGLFKKFGLNIELQILSGGVKCFEQMAAGDAEFATVSETVVMFNSFFRDDFSVLASFVESDNDLKLLSLTPEKYLNVADLEGVRVGMIKGSASEFFVDNTLILNSKNLDFIDRVYFGAHELVPNLLAGKVDIISAWEPLGYQVSQIAAGASQILSTKGLYSLSFNLIAKKSRDLKQNEVNVRILLALSEAIELINEAPLQHQQEVSQLLKVSLSQLSYSWGDYTFRLSLGNALVSNLQTQAQWAVESRLVPGDILVDFRDVIDTQAFEDISTQRGGW
ncbi:ABC transporter substrate-binding protein [Shewanella sp. SR44-3]|uniref:ABC transporter substrate-binding protein n=1 Tax=Shewanella sp. SR44-3 TaxID=2760936 RepID=UPI0015FAE0A3|nr:ABC transporter substrate-binding protein [Shewanella sp. SR44-3]MBB1269033.1 ABC transporter substrate-binding protein [Shewanella sp. SR44-3]